MRDAFGGAFLIKLLVIFLGIYIAFMAVALNYAKAFRVKNQIINYIEQYEGYNDLSKAKIDDYVAKIAYYVKGINTNEQCYAEGYCVASMAYTENRGEYFLVTTYIHLELPFFGLSFNIPIKGETRLIYNG